MAGWRIGVDSGGTFTDICLFRDEGAIEVWKVPSTPEDPSEAIVLGFEEALRQSSSGRDQSVDYFGHGTTVATNALIERSGAAIGLVTTAGFRDLLEIGRQRRPDLYDLQCDKPPCLVPRNLRLEAPERMRHDGRVETPLDEDAVRAAARRLRAAGVEGVAVCLLYSYVAPEHERRVCAILAEELPGAFVSASHTIAPEFREYERLSTVVVNVYVGPTIKRYLGSLHARLTSERRLSPPYITQSNGGTISVETAMREPVRTLLSGPATGVTAAVAICRAAELPNAITFDMGGTSTDVSVIESSGPTFAKECALHGYPLKIPMLDIHTVGAGGGSIAYVDQGGLLKVGPKSAGANPGPACYGRGDEPTVCDANVVLQTLNPNSLLGGRMPIDAERSRSAVASLTEALDIGLMEAAQGIVSVVTANMARAIRLVSVQRGRDPRDYTLLAFGGAGPLHAARLAQELDMPRVLIPRYPGLLCAMGLLLADLKRQFLVTRHMVLSENDPDAIVNLFNELERRAREWFAAEDIEAKRQRTTWSVDARYLGQNYELNIPISSDLKGSEIVSRLRHLFDAEHKRSFDYDAPDDFVQLVTFRVDAIAHVDKPELPVFPLEDSSSAKAKVGERKVWFPEFGAFVKCGIYRRDLLRAGNQISEPAVIEQMDSTSLAPPGWRAGIDEHLNIILERAG